MEKSEDKIQQLQVMWYKNKYCLSHHTPRNLIMSVPNEGKPEMIRTGLYPGASDLIVIHFGKVIFVENKTSTGRQSDNQIAFQKHVESLGFNYYLCRSLEEFQTIILNLCTPPHHSTASQTCTR